MIDSECNWVLCPGIKVLTSNSLTDIMILIIIFQQKISTWTIFIVFSEGRGGDQPNPLYQLLFPFSYALIVTTWRGWKLKLFVDYILFLVLIDSFMVWWNSLHEDATLIVLRIDIFLEVAAIYYLYHFIIINGNRQYMFYMKYSFLSICLKKSTWRFKELLSLGLWYAHLCIMCTRFWPWHIWSNIATILF